MAGKEFIQATQMTSEEKLKKIVSKIINKPVVKKSPPPKEKIIDWKKESDKKIKEALKSLTKTYNKILNNEKHHGWKL